MQKDKYKVYKFKGKNLVNLTPHNITILGEYNKPIFNIKPGNPLRLKEKVIYDDGLLLKKEYTMTEDVPKKENRIYIVSLVVAKYIEREDFAVPDIVRDSRGHKIGCKRLILAK